MKHHRPAIAAFGPGDPPSTPLPAVTRYKRVGCLRLADLTLPGGERVRVLARLEDAEPDPWRITPLARTGPAGALTLPGGGIADPELHRALAGVLGVAEGLLREAGGSAHDLRSWTGLVLDVPALAGARIVPARGERFVARVTIRSAIGRVGLDVPFWINTDPQTGRDTGILLDGLPWLARGFLDLLTDLGAIPGGEALDGGRPDRREVEAILRTGAGQIVDAYSEAVRQAIRAAAIAEGIMEEP